MKKSEIIAQLVTRVEALENAMIKPKSGENQLRIQPEVGGWYWFEKNSIGHIQDALVFVNDLSLSSNGNYGFNHLGEWLNGEGNSSYAVYNNLKIAKKATDEQVEEALIKESERRGIDFGASVILIGGRAQKLQHTYKQFNRATNELYIGNYRVFRDGEWAKPIQEEPGKDKIDVHVGLKFTTEIDGILYEITSISDDLVEIGWDGMIDRIDYHIDLVNKYFDNGDWKVSNTVDKFAELKEAYKNGAAIEYFNQHTKEWCMVSGKPLWGVHTEYRIKPEEEPRVGNVVKAWYNKGDGFVVGILDEIRPTTNIFPYLVSGSWFENVKTLNKQEAINLLFGHNETNGLEGQQD